MLIVATATSNEMKAALGFADAPVVEQGEAVEFEYGGYQLLLTVTGVGMVNAAMAAGRQLGRPGVTGVLNLGIAGAYLLNEFPLGSSAYAWRETWPEYGLLQENGSVDPKAIGFAQGQVGGKAVWDRINLTPVNDAETMNLSLPEGCARASSVSVNSVTGSPLRAGWLKMACSADIENMEGFALAFATMQKGLPFLEVRTISNMVGSREAEDWDLKAALGALEDAARQLFSGK